MRDDSGERIELTDLTDLTDRMLDGLESDEASMLLLWLVLLVCCRLSLASELDSCLCRASMLN
jgi:hypothetical protein